MASEQNVSSNSCQVRLVWVCVRREKLVANAVTEHHSIARENENDVVETDTGNHNHEGQIVREGHTHEHNAREGQIVREAYCSELFECH